jgi:PqqD family protein of HPr-rel-A system
VTCWRRGDGVLVEPIGHLWAAFSPFTGETTLLNDESASILEALEAGAVDTATVCVDLARHSGLEAGELAEIVDAALLRLAEAGLVREQATLPPAR